MHSQAGAGAHREGTWRVEAGRVFQAWGPELAVSFPRAAAPAGRGQRKCCPTGHVIFLEPPTPPWGQRLDPVLAWPGLDGEAHHRGPLCLLLSLFQLGRPGI